MMRLKTSLPLACFTILCSCNLIVDSGPKHRDGQVDTIDMLEPDGLDHVIDPGDDHETGEEAEVDEAKVETVDPTSDQIDDEGSEEAQFPPGLSWISIPRGSFDMGCSPGDTDCLDEEKPRHPVTVSAFQMTETEITQAQYEWVTEETPSHFSSCGESCPVEQVDWDQAKIFCESIGGRLPSEAEWEYAARARATTRYYCGDDEACLDGIAYYDANSDSSTNPVKGKNANPYGLYDMLGNVWEWVMDCWHQDYTDAPSDGGVWSGGNCDYHMMRGGSWNDDSGVLRVSVRHTSVLGFRHIGFRCARD
jgi:formylglycine-generating enzyme required for sulfatase activity